jgi:hypothetical protein
MNKMGLITLSSKSKKRKRSWMTYWNLKNYGGDRDQEPFGCKVGTKILSIST